MPQDLPTDDPYADAYAQLTRLSQIAPGQIVHLPGRTIATQEMIAEYSAARREGRAPALTAEEISAVREYWRVWFVRMGTELPKWRQETSKLLGTLDNIEDQLSTFSWLAGLLLKRTPLAPLANLRAVEHTQRALDGAQDLLTLRPGGRASKNEHEKRQRRRQLDKLRSGNALARGRAWLESNYGHLLEGAQATDTWWGVGVSIGPIMGALDEGYFYLARWANEGYLDMADLVRPGSKAAFTEWAHEADARIYGVGIAAWRAAINSPAADAIRRTNETIGEAYDTLGDWFSRGKLTAAGWVLEEPQQQIGVE